MNDTILNFRVPQNRKFLHQLYKYQLPKEEPTIWSRLVAWLVVDWLVTLCYLACWVQEHTT